MISNLRIISIVALCSLSQGFHRAHQSDSTCEGQIPAAAPAGSLVSLVKDGCRSHGPTHLAESLTLKRFSAGAGGDPSAYERMATVAESVYDASGLRAEEHDVTRFQMHDDSPAACHPPDRFVEKTVQELYEYAYEAQPGGLNTTERCNRLAATSLAWKMRSDYIDDDPGVLGMKQIVQEHHRWLEALYGRVHGAPLRLKGQSMQDCYTFPKPKERLCGGLAQYPDLVPELESLFPGGRNLMYHEFRELIDFTPYRPLPSLAGFDEASIKGRKTLIVAGANGFYRGAKHLIDMYSPYFDFDQVLLIEPDTQYMDVPEEYNRTGNVRYWQTYVEVKSCDKSDLVKYLQDNFHEDEFVVVMFDVDEGQTESTMEWGWLADLVSQKKRVVDELFIELHMYKPDIGWKANIRHSAQEQYDVMHQLRHVCGAAVHAWP